MSQLIKIPKTHLKFCTGIAKTQPESPWIQSCHFFYSYCWSTGNLLLFFNVGSWSQEKHTRCTLFWMCIHSSRKLHINSKEQYKCMLEVEWNGTRWDYCVLMQLLIRSVPKMGKKNLWVNEDARKTDDFQTKNTIISHVFTMLLYTILVELMQLWTNVTDKKDEYFKIKQ